MHELWLMCKYESAMAMVQRRVFRAGEKDTYKVMRYLGKDKYFSTDWAEAGETARGQVTKGHFSHTKIVDLYFQDKGRFLNRQVLQK